MAQVLNLCHPSTILTSTLNHSWASLQCNLKSRGRFTCLFSDNRKQEQAKKALESVLGGKKAEFEKWDKEIKKREEEGGGGDGGGGGWFRWGRWFGGSDGDHFWQEAQQARLTILGILVMGTRNGLTYVMSRILRKVSSSTGANFDNIPKDEVYVRDSAKEPMVRKWGSD